MKRYKTLYVCVICYRLLYKAGLADLQITEDNAQLNDDGNKRQVTLQILSKDDDCVYVALRNELSRLAADIGRLL